MADLYVSLLGRPLRAVVAYANGRRALVKIGDRRDDEFGLDPDVWIDREGGVAGAQAAYLARSGQEGEFFRLDPARFGAAGDEGDGAAEWTQRELLGIVLRRFLTAAEAQAGEPLTRVVALLAPQAGPEAAAVCAQAAMLAGALEIETLELDRCLAPPAGEGVEVVVEAWDDGSRVTALAAGKEPRTHTAGAGFSPGRMRELLSAAFSLPSDVDASVHVAVETELFERWTSASGAARGAAVVRPASRMGPVSVFVPARTFAKLDAELGRALGDAFAEAGIAPERVVSARVLGSWVRPVARALQALLPAARVRDERGGELDAAVTLRPPAPVARTPRLRADLLAVAQAERTLRGIAQGAPVPLLAAGVRLPAAAVFEDFASSRFIETFWVAARDEAATTPMLRFAIPRYAERQQNSYLRAVVHADTADLLLLECAYLYPSRRRFAFFDRTRARELPVSERAFRIVRGS